MKSFSRLLVLSVFAAAGAGTAIYVGLHWKPAAGLPSAAAAEPVAGMGDTGVPPVNHRRDAGATGVPPVNHRRDGLGDTGVPPVNHRRDAGATRDLEQAPGSRPDNGFGPPRGQSPPPLFLRTEMPAPRYLEPLPQRARQSGGTPPAAANDPSRDEIYRGILETMTEQSRAFTAVMQDRKQPPPTAVPAAPSTAPPADAGPGNPFQDDPTQLQVEPKGDDRFDIHTTKSDVRQVLQMIATQGGVNILMSKKVSGTVAISLKNVDFAGALQAVLNMSGYVARRDGQAIYVGTPEDILALDHAHDKIGVRIYHPNYVRAAELEGLLTPFLTQGVGQIKVTSPALAGIGSDSTTVEGDNYAGSDVVVVRDYTSVLEVIDQMIVKIDRRPMQVAIEAMILSVKLDDEFQFGVDFELLRDRNNARLISGSPLSDLATINTSDGGLKFGFLDSSLAVFLDALEEIGDTNVIATPRLLCLNKHRAEIHIGEELGYVSTSQTETSTTQSVEFLEVGTQLRIRPFISSDGTVRMEVHPELSKGTVVERANFTVPNKEVTQVTSNIMVRDGCTVVIGGLLSEDLSVTGTQIPFFGSLPLVGPLFRSQTENTTRNEIIVLITPRIVYDPETCCEGEKAAHEFHRRQSVYANHMSPFGKRYLGKRQFRLAQDAWSAGDGRAALHHVSKSIQFDPMNRAAIQLRTEILDGVRFGEHTLERPGPVLAGDLLDGPQLPPWLLDDLRVEPGFPGPPLHPRDPGQPGPRYDIDTGRAY